MQKQVREFHSQKAVREATPLLVGLCSPSGGGKTYSALRLACGMQKVNGGKIFHLDTETGRALHYAEEFDFEHVPFPAPYAASDYMAGIEHCATRGAGVIIIDSFSHEHESTGGYLEYHDAEMDRLAGLWRVSREKTNPSAWINPKKERRKLVDYILHLPICFIFCFRAKEKTEWKAGEKPVPQGWVPVGGMDYVYELTVCCLFEPRADGVPTWKKDDLSESQRVFVKLPKQFKGVLDTGDPLDEKMGEKMALWASGGKKLSPDAHAKRAEAIATTAAVAAGPVRVQPGSGPDVSEPCPRCKSNAPICASCKKPLMFRKEAFAYKSTTELTPARWACANTDCDHKQPNDRRKTTNYWACDWHEMLVAQQPTQPHLTENLDSEPAPESAA